MEFDVPCINIVGDEDVIVNLAGFTVSGDIFSNEDTKIVIQNGTIDGGAIILYSGSDHLIDNITIQNYDGQFAVIMPSGRIIDSTFENNNIAIDLYYGGSRSAGIEVFNNDFINNQLAINITRDSNSLIYDNLFVNNETGIRLYDEDYSGVNDTLIVNNSFTSNSVGVFINASNTVNGTMIEGNTFRSNSSSAIVVLVDCFMSSTTECAGRGTVIEGNYISRNGFDPSNITGGFQGSDFEYTPYDVLADDGVLIMGSETDQAANGVTLTGNYSYLNAALGINAENAVDGGSNVAFLNGDSRDCVGIDC